MEQMNNLGDIKLPWLNNLSQNFMHQLLHEIRISYVP
jgi:hypothetical protein